MTLAMVFGVSHTFLLALLTYLAETLLLRNNLLPRIAYELKHMIRRLGLEHQRIDTCPNEHILYEGEVNGELSECPRCMHPRYVPGSSQIPFAGTRYFPVIPKLRRLFQVSEDCRTFESLLGQCRRLDNNDIHSRQFSVEGCL